MSVDNNKSIYLTCIHCHYEFTHKDVFVAYFDADGKVIVASCINRNHQSNDKKEKVGGWGVLIRTYNEYRLIDINGL